MEVGVEYKDCNDSLGVAADVTGKEERGSRVSFGPMTRNTGRGMESFYSPTEQFNLYPIGCDESTVANREETAEVGAPPEVISGKTTDGKLQGVL